MVVVYVDRLRRQIDSNQIIRSFSETTFSAICRPSSERKTTQILNDCPCMGLTNGSTVYFRNFRVMRDSFRQP